MRNKRFSEELYSNGKFFNAISNRGIVIFILSAVCFNEIYPLLSY